MFYPTRSEYSIQVYPVTGIANAAWREHTSMPTGKYETISNARACMQSTVTSGKEAIIKENYQMLRYL